MQVSHVPATKGDIKGFRKLREGVGTRGSEHTPRLRPEFRTLAGDQLHTDRQPCTRHVEAILPHPSHD